MIQGDAPLHDAVGWISPWMAACAQGWGEYFI